MGEERLYILKMLEEGKITAEEAEALLQALESDGWSEGDEKGDQGGGGTDRTGDRASEDRDEGTAYGFSRDFADQIRDTIQAALKNVPHVTEELRENWQDVRDEIRHSLREIQEEMRKGPLIDIRGLSDLFVHLRGRGPVHEFEERFTGEFDPAAAGHPQVEIEARNGSVTVTGWDRPTYEVLLRKRVHGRDEAEAAEAAQKAVDVEKAPGRLGVRSVAGESVSVTIEVKLPRALAYQLEARSQNGSIAVERLEVTTGRAETANGSVRLAEVRGERMTAETTNGKVVCDDVAIEDIRARTVNGAVAWEGIAREASVETVNGILRLAPKGPGAASRPAWAGEGLASRYVASSHNGGIRVQLPPAREAGVRFEAEARTVDAPGASEGFQIERRGGLSSGRQVKGASHGYDEAPHKVELSLRTVNGSIQIERKGREGK